MSPDLWVKITTVAVLMGALYLARVYGIWVGWDHGFEAGQRHEAGHLSEEEQELVGPCPCRFCEADRQGVTL